MSWQNADCMVVVVVVLVVVVAGSIGYIEGVTLSTQRRSSKPLIPVSVSEKFCNIPMNSKPPLTYEYVGMVAVSSPDCTPRIPRSSGNTRPVVVKKKIMHGKS